VLAALQRSVTLALLFSAFFGLFDSPFRLFPNELPHLLQCQRQIIFLQKKVLWKNFPRERPDTLTSPAAGS
jgi:hypothetical protein